MIRSLVKIHTARSPPPGTLPLLPHLRAGSITILCLSALWSRSGRSFSVNETEATAFIAGHFLSATVVALPNQQELPLSGGPPHQHRLGRIAIRLLARMAGLSGMVNPEIISASDRLGVDRGQGARVSSGAGRVKRPPESFGDHCVRGHH